MSDLIERLRDLHRRYSGGVGDEAADGCDDAATRSSACAANWRRLRVRHCRCLLWNKARSNWPRRGGCCNGASDENWDLTGGDPLLRISTPSSRRSRSEAHPRLAMLALFIAVCARFSTS